MCLLNERQIKVKACYGYALQIRVYDDLQRRLEDTPYYRGIFNGNAIPIMEEREASHLRTIPKDAGFYGFNKLSDARKIYRKECKGSYSEWRGRVVIVLCEFRDIFEIGSPNIYGENWEEEITAFRARYKTILCEVLLNKPKKEKRSK